MTKINVFPKDVFKDKEEEEEEEEENAEHNAWQRYGCVLKRLVKSFHLCSAKNKMDGSNDFPDWVKMISEFSSIHGFIWYTRFSSRVTKAVVFFFVAVVTFGLPCFMAAQFIQFYQARYLEFKVYQSVASSLNF